MNFILIKIIKSESEIITLSHKPKLGGFLISRTALQKIIQGHLLVEGKLSQMEAEIRKKE